LDRLIVIDMNATRPLLFDTLKSEKVLSAQRTAGAENLCRHPKMRAERPIPS
jgi:hypothetical protein